MGHSIYYKLTEEQLLNKFPLNYNFNDSTINEVIEELKQDITTFVAKWVYDSSDQINVARLVLRQRLQTLYRYVYDKTILDHINQLRQPDLSEDSPEIWVTPNTLYANDSESDVYRYTIKYLLQYAFYPEPDLLEDPEKNDTYWGDIEEYIEGFIESVDHIVEQQIIKTLDEAVEAGENIIKTESY